MSGTEWKAPKIGETLWEVGVTFGEMNDTIEVEVTAKGIEVNYQLIPWEDLLKAKGYVELREIKRNKDRIRHE